MSEISTSGGQDVTVSEKQTKLGLTLMATSGILPDLDPSSGGWVATELEVHEIVSIDTEPTAVAEPDTPRQGPIPFDPVQHLIKVQGGRDYLETKWRLVWLRDVHPNATVTSEIVHMDDTSVTIRAEVRIPYLDETGELNYAIGVGHSREAFANARFPVVETCETSALGRALAAVGFGTQFSGSEFDTGGERLADSPAGGAGQSAPASNAKPRAPRANSNGNSGGAPRQQMDIPAPNGPDGTYVCDACEAQIVGNETTGEGRWSAGQKAMFSVRDTGTILCKDCSPRR